MVGPERPNSTPNRTVIAGSLGLGPFNEGTSRMRAGHINRTIDAILAQTDDLRDLARRPETVALRAAEVSHWSVGQQLEHLALSDLAILDGIAALLAGKLESAGGGPTWSGRLVLVTGWIPRGKGRAPEQTVPQDADSAAIGRQLEEAQRRFVDLREHASTLSASRATYRHPLLGSLTASQWLDFTRIHHAHHAKVVAEIRRASE